MKEEFFDYLGAFKKGDVVKLFDMVVEIIGFRYRAHSNYRPQIRYYVIGGGYDGKGYIAECDFDPSNLTK